ncbi:uncharacterized protein LOC142589013 isoform X2 [Dermacentor variabilis]|uniref:uncharacterized protein LOC142589013 isoform X2 n=1 Tax=Dermacentor variabilis TaxID=34621 RepID=UPI003F5C8DBE
MLGASFMTYMASIQRSSLVLHLFLAFYITASTTRAASSEHSGWKISIVIFEDSTQQHPNNTVKAKEAYYEEMFNSVSRRLDLLSSGRFEFVRREYHPEKLCFVFCCSGFRSPRKIVAPDGLQCGKDATGVVDRRCINGICEKIN